MKIEIDGVAYDVPEAYVQKLASDLWAQLETMYEEKLDDGIKSLFMAGTRAFLVKEEMSVRMKHGKEAARALRPPPKSDPTLWLARMMLPTMQRMLQDVTVTCETAGSSVTALSLSVPRASEQGGQVDTTGNERLRQNNRP